MSVQKLSTLWGPAVRNHPKMNLELPSNIPHLFFLGVLCVSSVNLPDLSRQLPENSTSWFESRRINH